MAKQLTVPEVKVDALGNVVVGIAGFLLMDSFIDSADPARFLVGQLAPLFEWVVCIGAGVFAYKAAKRA